MDEKLFNELEVIDSIREELVRFNEMAGAMGQPITGDDYKYLGVVIMAFKRLRDKKKRKI